MVKINIPCVVIGAGLAGLLASYRLQSKLKGETILLIDEKNKEGGRIKTRIDSYENVQELGAMRISEHQFETTNLCNELEINLTKFPSMNTDNTLIYMNNKRTIELSGGKLNIETCMRNNMEKYISKNFKKDQFDNNAYKRLLEEDLQKDYYSISFDEAIRILMSQEEYLVYRKISGYTYMYNNDVSFHGVMVANRNIHESSKIFTIQSGMIKICEKLKIKFKKSGGLTIFGEKIISIRKVESSYELTTNKKIIICKVLIVAIPPKQLLDINIEEGIIDNQTKTIFKDNIGSYASRKTFAVFSENWWEKDSKRSQEFSLFRSDNKLRQGYFPICQTSKEIYSMLIEYSNVKETDYSIDENNYIKQLEEMTNRKITGLEEIYTYDWRYDLSKISAHYLKIGGKYTDIIGVCYDEKNKIYYIGEAYSTQHGWMAGAIESVNSLIKQTSVMKKIQLS